ncbi:Aste57867_24211 [Aphanomyces stellatus]|uniref:Aste57867_24211 protein n=1 Tax=Aphanomyces stellatus TaxID=120398 RepID=A0A485LRL6_9STRA|nr:hypothetical protein As57867_024136 [Aphanomyces stellatus]VFU00853.1 Aste57867_24211 [Aphanomyces stellatus]
MNKDHTRRNDPPPASSPIATPTATLHAMESQGLDSTPVLPSMSSDLGPVRQTSDSRPIPRHDESKTRFTAASAPAELVQRLPDSDSDVAVSNDSHVQVHLKRALGFRVRHHRNSPEQRELDKLVRPASDADAADELSLDNGA